MRTAIVAVLLVLASCASAPAGPAENVRPATVPAAPTAKDVAVPAPSKTAPAKKIEHSLESISIADLVKVAISRNPDLGMAEARIEAARQTVREAHSAFLPTLGLGLGYTVSNDPVLVFMDTLRNRELSFSGNFNEPGWRGNARASAKVGWLVFDGGHRSAAEDLAKTSVRMSVAGRAAFENGLKAAVIETGLAVYQAEDFLGVAKDSVKLVEQQLATSRSRYAAGAAQRSDVLSVEVRLAAAKEDVVKARNARDRALAALRNLAGIRADEPFSLESGGGFHVPRVESKDLMETARENRPEMRRAAEAVEAARRAIDLATTGNKPRVSTFGSYDLDDEYAGFRLSQDSFTAGIQVDVPIFDGYRTDAAVAKARAQLRLAREGRRKMLLAIESDVTQARLALEEARERRLVSKKAKEQASEALSLIRARYQTGAATITETMDAEVALTGARVRDVAARFAVERATAELRRALGTCRAETGGKKQ